MSDLHSITSMVELLKASYSTIALEELSGPVFTKPNEVCKKSCECGAHKTANANLHSDWCPAHE